MWDLLMACFYFKITNEWLYYFIFILLGGAGGGAAGFLRLRPPPDATRSVAAAPLSFFPAATPTGENVGVKVEHFEAMAVDSQPPEVPTIVASSSTTIPRGLAAAAASIPTPPVLHRRKRALSFESEKKTFLGATRVLLRVLEARDPAMHKQAKSTIAECSRRNETRDILEARLRALVGPESWAQALDLFDKLSKKKAPPPAPSTIAVPPAPKTQEPQEQPPTQPPTQPTVDSAPQLFPALPNVKKKTTADSKVIQKKEKTKWKITKPRKGNVEQDFDDDIEGLVKLNLGSTGS